MKARKVFLASGGTITIEAHEDRCWHSEEIDSVEIELDKYDFETICDICGEVIQADPYNDEDEKEEDK